MSSQSVLKGYLDKQSVYDFDFLSKPINADIIITIPCHNEPDIISPIHSIYQNDRKEIKVLVIVVINHGVSANNAVVEQNTISYKNLVKWSDNTLKDDSFSLGIIKAYNLPDKKAGVGLARKIAMDKAVDLFCNDNKDGTIACYDADSLCLPNYITEVATAFVQNEKLDGISIHYEHPIEGDDYPDANYISIIQYEAHLRYFIEAQRKLSLPYAYHTVGSSMAVRASSYAKLGGMNQRKAGEDFYFLQKVIENGLVEDLNTTMVIPSPRLSDRVPFGTGKAINDLINGGDLVYMTYHPKSFEVLIPFIDSIQDLYNYEIPSIFDTYHIGLVEYFKTIDFESKIKEGIDNTSSYDSFRKRIFKHFNAFQLMKYLHYMRDHYFGNIPIEEALSMVRQKETVDIISELQKLRVTQSAILSNEAFILKSVDK